MMAPGKHANYDSHSHGSPDARSRCMKHQSGQLPPFKTIALSRRRITCVFRGTAGAAATLAATAAARDAAAADGPCDAAVSGPPPPPPAAVLLLLRSLAE